MTSVAGLDWTQAWSATRIIAPRPLPSIAAFTTLPKRPAGRLCGSHPISARELPRSSVCGDRNSTALYLKATLACVARGLISLNPCRSTHRNRPYGSTTALKRPQPTTTARDVTTSRMANGRAPSAGRAGSDKPAGNEALLIGWLFACACRRVRTGSREIRCDGSWPTTPDHPARRSPLPSAGQRPRRRTAGLRFAHGSPAQAGSVP